MFIAGVNHQNPFRSPLSHLLLVLLLVLRVRPGAAAVGAANAVGVLTFAVQEEAPNGTKARGHSTPLRSTPLYSILILLPVLRLIVYSYTRTIELKQCHSVSTESRQTQVDL